MAPIRVLIADDHPFFRDGVSVLLAASPATTVVGEASTGDEVIALAASLTPDVILMDLKMPGLNGIAATRRILADNSHVAVLVLTMYDDDDSVFAALRAGARGYLLKGANEEELLRAIHGVAHGEAIYGPPIARLLLRFFATPALSAPPPPFATLTAREREVLAELALGRRNPEIAARLFLSPKTVRNHVSNILGKLQVTDRAQAIVRAREAGFGKES
jgi:DNA-binding NarL/FixJ family response regulator